MPIMDLPLSSIVQFYFFLHYDVSVGQCFCGLTAGVHFSCCFSFVTLYNGWNIAVTAETKVEWPHLLYRDNYSNSAAIHLNYTKVFFA